MAASRSSQYPYQWPDGSWHSVSWQVHQQNVGYKTPGSANLAQIAAGAPVGSPAPQTPGAAAQPFDPAFEAQKQGAQWGVSLAGSEGNYQRGNLAYNSGYNADGSVNASNPYSQAALLQDSYKRSQAGTQNSYAAQGQLYSGARLNAVARDDRNYAVASDTLKRGTADAYHGIGVNQLQSYGQNALGVSQSDYEALRRAIYGG